MRDFGYETRLGFGLLRYAVAAHNEALGLCAENHHRAALTGANLFQFERSWGKAAQKELE